ncbi:glycosyltransferase, partial [Flavobacteriaceae bacterium]|nr:glycosyltransferase [Flavobacteriaceae bacterium]
MAHIFKHPENGNKGIIIFTHKELKLFIFKINRRTVKSPLINLFIYFNFKNKIKKIKKKYLVGVHWGSFSKNQMTPSWVDFHMTAPGTASFRDNPKIIPYNSANFTPIVMRKELNAEKYWDIICVAHNANKKKYPELLRSIRKLYDMDSDVKVLFVIASLKTEPNKNYYNNIFKDYFNLFSAKEREFFTIIKTHPETGFQGFSYTFLSYLYNRSKIFTIFSQMEGECRVVKEAQLCGLPVVVKSDVQGGIRDYLNADNSLFFDEYESAHLTLKKAVDNFEAFNVDPDFWAKELREDYSLENLKKHFKELYKSKGLVFDGKLINTDNLNRR